MGWDIDGLIEEGKEKKNPTHKQRKGSCSPHPTGRPMSHQSPNKRHTGSKKSPFFFLCLSFYFCTYNTQYRISIWPIWVGCPTCVPTQPLAHFQPTHWAGRVGKKKALMLCEHHSATAKTLVYYQCFFSCKSKALRLWWKLTPKPNILALLCANRGYQIPQREMSTKNALPVDPIGIVLTINTKLLISVMWWGI